jgi:uncharacterized protein (DUF362 family)
VPWDLSAARGKRVLLKPNAGRVARQGSGVITDARVVAAACDAFREVGAAVSVGDSPIVGVEGIEALEASGMAAAAREHGARVIDLDARRAAVVKLPEGVALGELKVCPEVLDHDLVVSIPVMKTHMHTGVTLAVKNMKGALWRRFKVELHMLPPVPGREEKSLDLAIADMSVALRPHFSIVDGTVGMEGLGPSAGTAKPLGVILTAADAYAADAVACHLMGRNAAEIAHLREGAQRGLGVIELEGIDVEPADWESWVDPFEAAPQNLSVEFPGVRVLDEASCSACQSTLLLFLNRFGTELREYFPDGPPIHAAIGKGHEQVPAGTLCIGNCTRQHKAAGVYVAGCPPVGSAILATIKRKNAASAKDGDADG